MNNVIYWFKNTRAAVKRAQVGQEYWTRILDKNTGHPSKILQVKAERPSGFSDSPYFLPRLPSPASIRADRSDFKLAIPFQYRSSKICTIPTRKLPPYLGHLPGLSGSGCDCSDVSKYKSPKENLTLSKYKGPKEIEQIERSQVNWANTKVPRKTPHFTFSLPSALVLSPNNCPNNCQPICSIQNCLFLKTMVWSIYWYKELMIGVSPLLTPTGALIVMMCYYIFSRQPLFEIFTQSIDAIDVTSVTRSR